MITIQTVNSKIVNNDGSAADGHLVITPNDSFEFLDTDAKRKKVSKENIAVTFTAGVLVAFSIAPTLNASQDKANLYYTASFFTNDSQWTEYWTIDAAGGTLEITDVTQVVVSPVASTVSYITSDIVSVTPLANGIPRADANGLIASGWLVAGGSTLVYFFTDLTLPGDPLGTPPVGVTLAIGYRTVNGEVYVYAGGTWRTIGG